MGKQTPMEQIAAELKRMKFSDMQREVMDRGLYEPDPVPPYYRNYIPEKRIPKLAVSNVAEARHLSGPNRRWSET